MTSRANFGNIAVESAYEEAQIEWKVEGFSSIANGEDFENCESPDFFFGNASWYFGLFPISILQPDCINLYLVSKKNRKYSVEYTLSLKRVDNSVEQLYTGILNEKDTCTVNCFIKRSGVLQRKNELAPSGVLTFVCTLKRGTIPSIESQVLFNEKPKKLIKLETLSENFKNLSCNKESCDVTLHVQNKEYKAHKAVLIARSSVFSAMFQHDTSEKQTGIVNIPDCDPESFEKFLEFLYSGKLDELSPSNATYLYETSEKYNIQELKIFCSEYIMKNLTVENLCDVVITADKYDDEKLLSAVQRFFNNNLNKVLKTSEWEYLLKNYHRLANKLLLEMSTKMKSVE